MTKDAKAEGRLYDLPVSLPARDRKFVQELADNLHLRFETVENDQHELHLQLSFPKNPQGDRNPEDDSEDTESDDDDESQVALRRVLKRYETAKVLEVIAEDAKKAAEKKY